jgi:hypothetical protein
VLWGKCIAMSAYKKSRKISNKWPNAISQTLKNKNKIT